MEYCIDNRDQIVNVQDIPQTNTLCYNDYVLVSKQSRTGSQNIFLAPIFTLQADRPKSASADSDIDIQYLLNLNKEQTKLIDDLDENLEIVSKKTVVLEKQTEVLQYQIVILKTSDENTKQQINNSFLLHRYFYIIYSAREYLENKQCIVLYFELFSESEKKYSKIRQSNNVQSLTYIEIVNLQYNTIKNFMIPDSIGLSFDNVSPSTQTKTQIKDDKTLTHLASVENIDAGYITIPKNSTYKLSINKSNANPFSLFDILPKINYLPSFGFSIVNGVKPFDLEGNNLNIYTFFIGLDRDATAIYNYSPDKGDVVFFARINSISKVSKNTIFNIDFAFQSSEKLHTKNINFTAKNISPSDFVSFLTSFNFSDGVLTLDIGVFSSSDQSIQHQTINLGQTIQGGLLDLLRDSKTRLILAGQNGLKISHFGFLDVPTNQQQATNLFTTLFIGY